MPAERLERIHVDRVANGYIVRPRAHEHAAVLQEHCHVFNKFDDLAAFLKNVLGDAEKDSRNG